MSINRFPYQDDILRQLSGGSASVSEIATAIAGEGRHSAEGHDSDELHRSVAENVDHLVHLGLVEYSGSGADRRGADHRRKRSGQLAAVAAQATRYRRCPEMVRLARSMLFDEASAEIVAGSVRARLRPERNRSANGADRGVATILAESLTRAHGGVAARRTLATTPRPAR